MGTLHLPKKEPTPSRAEQARRLRYILMRAERVARATEWLIQTYPAFALCLPLALGIHRITHREKPKWISGNTLALAREQWCASPRYLGQLAKPGAIRHNLDGTLAEPVSDEHRAAAAAKLAAQ